MFATGLSKELAQTTASGPPEITAPSLERPEQPIGPDPSMDKEQADPSQQVVANTTQAHDVTEAREDPNSLQDAPQIKALEAFSGDQGDSQAQPEHIQAFVHLCFLDGSEAFAFR
ncbi:hypothetical protein K2173_017482 [Erythroxylum novogranatense]|uniref:Uncharacterized protein n=1 Tax=Erythroxylum novogranatense TaxID=1862640 RepID=A0AAV8TMK5_9ROSI|nr:hypothetical protein K2173_017482 [Erythroxylum novogranatense]